MAIIVCLIIINVIVAAVCWDVLTHPEKLSIHWRLTALWGFLANIAVFGFNLWLFLGLL